MAEYNDYTLEVVHDTTLLSGGRIFCGSKATVEGTPSSSLFGSYACQDSHPDTSQLKKNDKSPNPPDPLKENKKKKARENREKDKQLDRNLEEAVKYMPAMISGKEEEANNLKKDVDHLERENSILQAAQTGVTHGSRP